MTESKDDRVFDVDAADLEPSEMAPGVDRRDFMVRSAVMSAVAVIAGCSKSVKLREGGLAVSVVLC